MMWEIVWLLVGMGLGWVISQFISCRDLLSRFTNHIVLSLARIEANLQANKSRDRTVLDRMTSISDDTAKLVIYAEEVHADREGGRAGGPR